MALSTSNAEKKAQDFLNQGEKALGRFSIFSSGTKFEDASEAFEKAGNQFKIAKKWQAAGDMYAKCATCQLKMKETSRAAQFYQMAADAMKKVNPEGATKYFQQAIAMLCDAGRFTSAAKMQKEIAEIYEKEDNLEAAIENYRQAAEYYSGENQQSSANTMMLKVAQFSAQLEEYEEAAEIYENIATSCMESNLMKFNAKGHLLNAGICIMAMNDSVLVNQKKDTYEEIDFTFADSREGKLFQALADAFENLDPDEFADAIYQYDSISKLDAWKISYVSSLLIHHTHHISHLLWLVSRILLAIKNSMEGGANDSVDLL